MRIVVVEPPAPLITPADVPGSHAADDATVAAWIAAAQAEIDGPDGMLGRAIGVQLLELQIDGFPWLDLRHDASIRLPCPPVIDVVSISYTDPDGVDTEVDSDAWYFQPGTDRIYPAVNFAWPTAYRRAGSVRIRFHAGYDEIAVAEGGTGEAPAQVRQAIILLAGLYNSTGADNLFLSQVTVDGVGSRSYVVSDGAGKAVRSAVDRLLSGLKVNLL